MEDYIYGNIVMKHDRRIIVLLFLLVISVFSSHDIYSFNPSAILENSFNVGISLACGVSLFCLLGYFYCQSASNRERSTSNRERSASNRERSASNKERSTVHHIKVLRRTGADCGFYAIKNAELLLRIGIFNKTVLGKSIRKAGFPELEEWRKYTKENFDVESWLDESQVKAIVLHKTDIDHDKFTIQQVGQKASEHDLLNNNDWRRGYYSRISELVTATIEKASSLKDKTILEKLHELK